MSTPMRLNDSLVHDAEVEAITQKRTAPKQIEFWAEIGKAVAGMVSSSALLSIVQGFSHINVLPNPSSTVSTHDVLEVLERDREDGSLYQTVTQAKVWYEASQVQPGLLDRVTANGQRETGHFRDGQFTPVSQKG